MDDSYQAEPAAAGGSAWGAGADALASAITNDGGGQGQGQGQVSSSPSWMPSGDLTDGTAEARTDLFSNFADGPGGGGFKQEGPLPGGWERGPTTRSDGTQVDTLPNGSEREQRPDGTVAINNSDGSRVGIHPDGSTQIWRPDGSHEVSTADGTQISRKPDGSTTTTQPDGTRVQTSPDGKTEIYGPDGKRQDRPARPR